jgi:hypothetical protein
MRDCLNASGPSFRFGAKLGEIICAHCRFLLWKVCELGIGRVEFTPLMATELSALIDDERAAGLRSGPVGEALPAAKFVHELFVVGFRDPDYDRTDQMMLVGRTPAVQTVAIRLAKTLHVLFDSIIVDFSGHGFSSSCHSLWLGRATPLMTTQPKPQFFNAAQPRSPTASNATPFAGSLPRFPVSGSMNFVFPSGKMTTGKLGTTTSCHQSLLVNALISPTP